MFNHTLEGILLYQISLTHLGGHTQGLHDGSRWSTRGPPSPLHAQIGALASHLVTDGHMSSVLPVAYGRGLMQQQQHREQKGGGGGGGGGGEAGATQAQSSIILRYVRHVPVLVEGQEDSADKSTVGIEKK
jgi:hypothetical protein